MQKNWYVVYTKPQHERRVSHALSKRKIENFCPLNCKVSKGLFRKFVSFEPVFTSYVFVNCTEHDLLQAIIHYSGVISVLYWKGKPASVRDSEIQVIKDFSKTHHDIRVEKIKEEAPAHKTYEIDGQLVRVKNKPIKVDLPSLGFSMVANVEDENVFNKSRSVKELGRIWAN